jgi:hypothetical protein
LSVGEIIASQPEFGRFAVFLPQLRESGRLNGVREIRALVRSSPQKLIHRYAQVRCAKGSQNHHLAFWRHTEKADRCVVLWQKCFTLAKEILMNLDDHGNHTRAELEMEIIGMLRRLKIAPIVMTRADGDNLLDTGRYNWEFFTLRGGGYTIVEAETCRLFWQNPAHYASQTEIRRPVCLFYTNKL